jgi:formylglycine-generating enzyme required for sulfatase activity
MDGDVLGTPAYMSPEQAAGKLADLGPRSDVYSVGSMLYHLLAGHMPYGDLDPPPTHMELWKLVRSRPPTPLHVRAPAASPEIVAICEKALERDVGRRYASMAELAEDLHAYVEGRVVRAYETGAVAELRKWVARNRGLAAALLAAVAALAVGLVVTVHLRGESEEQRRNVLNLSAFRKLADLRARADALWPVHPDLIDDYERWLREARALVGGLEALDASPGHRAALRALRANGRPRDPDELELLVRSHERYGELTGVRSELAARERASDVRARAAAVAEVEVVDEVRGLPAMTLNSLAWALVKPDRAVFGREPEGLAWARLAKARAGPGDDGAEIADTLAWAHLANGLDAEALEWARAAVDAAEPGGRQPYEEKLRAITAAREAAGERARIELLRRRAARLRDEVYGDLGWEFDDEQSAWWHEQLARLVRELDALADEESGLISGASVERGWGIERRLAAARRIEELTVTGAAARAAWAAATEAIARHAEFGGRTISPQPGLLPLGPDPASGLFEFAHVLTGAVPWRAPDGALRVERDTCMVFVLLPGGRFEMGASAAPDAARHDPLAKPDEAPVHALTLGSFFLSKYELTQAQWTRFVGANPSFFQSGMSKAGKPVFDTNPLESVSWWEARATLARLDLELPTEAQWEYAARAGTPGPWYTGAAPEELDGRANLADRAAADAGERWSGIDPSLSDGYVGHAPVGTFPPNPFGLHEMLGNVEEWCRDNYAVFSYDLPPRTVDGEHRAEGRPQRVTRGGSMTAGPREARCTAREHRQADYAFWNLGLRPARALRP